MIVEDHWKSASRWLIDLIDGRFSQKPQERKDVTTCVSRMKNDGDRYYDEEADEDYSTYQREKAKKGHILIPPWLWISNVTFHLSLFHKTIKRRRKVMTTMRSFSRMAVPVAILPFLLFSSLTTISKVNAFTPSFSSTAITARSRIPKTSLHRINNIYTGSNGTPIISLHESKIWWFQIKPK